MNWLLLIYICAPIFLALAVNAIIYLYGWTSNSTTPEKKVNILPPGWVIGMIWTIILGLLGFVMYEIRNMMVPMLSVAFLILFCVFYPFYTNGLQQKIGYIMNFVTFIVVMIVSIIVISYHAKAFVFMIPLVLWTTYVCGVTVYYIL